MKKYGLVLAVLAYFAIGGGVPTTAQTERDPIVRSVPAGLTVQTALHRIFLQADRKYRLEPADLKLSGQLQQPIERLPLSKALKVVLSVIQPPVIARVEQETYVISLRKSDLSGETEALPDVVVQSGSPGSIDGVAFSPNGKWIACLGGNGVVTVWDTTTGKMAHTFRGTMTSRPFSPDSRRIVTGMGSEAHLWSLIDGSRERSVGLLDDDRGTTFSSDGRQLFSIMNQRTNLGDGKILTWSQLELRELQTNRIVWQRKLPDKMYDATLSADGSHIAVWVPGENKINVVDAQDPSKGNLIDALAPVAGIAFSRDGTTLALATTKGAITLWDARTGTNLRDISPADQKRDTRRIPVAFSPDGSFLLTGSEWNRVRIWNLKTQQPTSLATSNGWTNSVAFSADGRQFAIGNSDRTLTLWDTELRQIIRRFDPSVDRVSFVTFTPTGKQLITGSQSGVTIWDRTMSHAPQFLAGHSPCRLSPDGQVLATTGDQNAVLLWDVASAKLLRALRGHSGPISAIAFSRDGTVLASGGSDQIVRIWSVGSGLPITSLSPKSGSIAHVEFGADQDHVVVLTNQRHIGIWDVRQMKLLESFIPQLDFTWSELFLSNDGRYLALPISETCRVIDTATTREIAALPTRRGMGSCTFTADNRFLITSTLGKIQQWELQTGREMFNADGLGHRPQFSPNEHLMITTGGFDRNLKLRTGPTISPWWNTPQVRLMDARTGGSVRILTGHAGHITTTMFSPDGSLLATGSEDGTTRLWDSKTGKEIARFITVGENGYVVATPAHYYMTSKNALRAMAFRFQGQMFPFEQFDLKYNRPDLVLKQLGAPESVVQSHARAYKKRLLKMKFTEDMLIGRLHVPEVRVLSVVPQTTSAHSISFTLKANDSEVSLDRLNIYANDVPVLGSAGIDLREQHLKEYQREVTVELVPGRNRIQVSALNVKGAESLMVTFEVTRTGASVTPALHLLVIGVSKYLDPAIGSLDYAAKDAGDMGAYFERHARSKAAASRYAKVYVYSLTNEEATRDRILAARDLLLKTNPEDTVMIFVAGHGDLDDNLDYYFLTHDAKLSNLAATALSYEQLENLLDGIPARKKLLLMDTCHAGEIDKDNSQPQALAASQSPSKDEPQPAAKSRAVKLRAGGASGLGLSNSFVLMQELFTNLQRGSGAQVIGASSGVEWAMEQGDLKNGVFTYALLQGLSTGAADADKDGVITVSELKDYVAVAVKKLTGGGQSPTARRESVEFDFAIQ